MELYLWIAILILAFSILVIVWKAIQVKKKHNLASFMTVEVVFVVMILLGMLIINKTSLEYENILTTTEEYSYQKSANEVANSKQSNNSNSEQDLVSNLISMQANTLSVTVMIVTISCIIISILTIYREKKAEINNQKVEDSLKKLEKTESIIQEIAAISSVLLLKDNQKDFFISIFKDEVERISLSKEPQDIAIAHFQMIMLNIILNDQFYMIKNDKDAAKYDIIISSANKIIESKDATHLSVSLAYVERAHAAYQKLKTSSDTKDVEQIKMNVKCANDYIRNLSIINDYSGNVLNLKGLIHLWTGIAMARINEITIYGEQNTPSDCLNHYSQALYFFDKAVEINKHKKEFKNHQVVALLRISDVCQDDSQKTRDLDIAKKICKNLFKESPNYIKPYINYADAIARILRIKLKPAMCWNEKAGRYIYSYTNFQIEDDVNQEEIKALRADALSKLKQAIEIESGFANSYYKRTEINLLWLGYKYWQYDNCQNNSTLNFAKISEICDKSSKDLSKAIEIIGSVTKIEGYKESLNQLIQAFNGLKKQNGKSNKKQRK